MRRYLEAKRSELGRPAPVQVEDASDRMRFSLSGEGGLNTGVAFPFVLLGSWATWPA